ncbi:hypothetical protein EDD22DRAFT_841899 [Suillus occidentalis]|nr:hypothetical protein EDD22DRAFT_841899 [Suillus occidentalis]
MSRTDGTPLPSVEQSPSNEQYSPNNCVVIIQNNYIAEGGTINIFSSNCNGSIVTKLEQVINATEEFAPSEPPPVTQAEPMKHGRENIVLSGNKFGECLSKPFLRPKLTAISSGME